MYDYYDLLDVIDMIFEFDRYPSIDEIAKECGLDPIYVEKLTNQLVQIGYVCISDYGIVTHLVDYDTMYDSIQRDIGE